MEPIRISGQFVTRKEDFFFAIGPIGCDSGSPWYDVRLASIRVAISAEHFEEIRPQFELTECTYLDKKVTPYKAYVNAAAVMCAPHVMGRLTHYHFRRDCVLEVLTDPIETQNFGPVQSA